MTPEQKQTLIDDAQLALVALSALAPELGAGAIAASTIGNAAFTAVMASIKTGVDVTDAQIAAARNADQAAQADDLVAQQEAKAKQAQQAAASLQAPPPPPV